MGPSVESASCAILPAFVHANPAFFQYAIIKAAFLGGCTSPRAPLLRLVAGLLVRRTLPLPHLDILPLLRLVAGLLVRRALPLPRLGVLPLLRLVAGLLVRRTLPLRTRPHAAACARRQSRGTHKASTFKSTKAVYFSSLTLLVAAASGRVAARQQTGYSRRSGIPWRTHAFACAR